MDVVREWNEKRRPGEFQKPPPRAPKSNRKRRKPTKKQFQQNNAPPGRHHGQHHRNQKKNKSMNSNFAKKSGKKKFNKRQDNNNPFGGNNAQTFPQMNAGSTNPFSGNPFNKGNTNFASPFGGGSSSFSTQNTNPWGGGASTDQPTNPFSNSSSFPVQKNQSGNPWGGQQQQSGKKKKKKKNINQSGNPWGGQQQQSGKKQKKGQSGNPWRRGGGGGQQQQQQSSNPFSQQTNNSNPFGQQKANNSNPFSQQTNNSNPFGQQRNDNHFKVQQSRSSFPVSIQSNENPWGQQQSSSSFPPTHKQEQNTTRFHGKPKPICRYWKTTGTCKFGDKCHYRHVLENKSQKQQQQGERRLDPRDGKMYTKSQFLQYYGDDNEWESAANKESNLNASAKSFQPAVKPQHMKSSTFWGGLQQKIQSGLQQKVQPKIEVPPVPVFSSSFSNTQDDPSVGITNSSTFDGQSVKSNVDAAREKNLARKLKKKKQILEEKRKHLKKQQEQFKSTTKSTGDSNTTPIGMDPSAFGGQSVKIKSNANAAREKFLARQLKKKNATKPIGMDPIAFGGQSVKIRSNADAAREKSLSRKMKKKKKKENNNKKKKQESSELKQSKQQLLEEKRKLLEQRRQRFAKKKKTSPPSPHRVISTPLRNTSSSSSSSSAKYISCKDMAVSSVPKETSIQWLPSTLRCWGTCEGMCPVNEEQDRRNVSNKNTSQRIKIQLNAGDAGVHVFEMRPQGRLITRYTRAAADKDLNADMASLRPPKWLAASVDQLMKFVLIQDCNYSDLNPNFQNLPPDQAKLFPTGRPKFANVCGYMLDRMRMIAKEFKQQGFAGDSESPASLVAVVALERVARFCIFAEWEFFSTSFDASIAERQKNEEHYNLLRKQLKRTLEMLSPMYEQVKRRLGYEAPNVAELEGYNTLLTLQRLVQRNFRRHDEVAAFMSTLQRFSTRGFFRDGPIERAVDLTFAIQNNQFAEFFRIMKEAPFLESVLMYPMLAKVRSNALEMLNQTVKNIPLSAITRQLAYETEESARADLLTHGLEVVIKGGVQYVKFSKQPLLESTAGEMILPRNLVASKAPSHRWHVVMGSSSSTNNNNNNNSTTLFATNASIPSPVKAPPSTPATVISKVKTPVKTATPPHRTRDAKRIASAIARSAAKNVLKIIKEMSETIEREIRIRGELKRRGESVRERMGRLCTAIGRTASADDGSSICSSDSNIPGSATLENNKALVSLNSRISKLKRELLNLRDRMAASVKDFIVEQDSVVGISSDHLRDRISKADESVQAAETTLRNTIREIRKLSEERISLIGREFQRRVASASSKLQHIIHENTFHGVHQNETILSLQREAKRDVDIAFSYVNRNTEKKQQGFAVSKAELSVEKLEVSTRKVLGKMQETLLRRNHDLVSTFRELSNVIYTNQDVPRVILDVHSELDSLLSNAQTLCGEEKKTSLLSLESALDEVKIATARMQDELNRWKRKQDLTTLRRWIRWWHYRARAISRGMGVKAEQRFRVERFRKSALATGSSSVLIDRMSGMNIIESRRQRHRVDQHHLKKYIIEEETDLPISLEDIVCDSFISRNESLILRTEKSGMCELYWQCAVLELGARDENHALTQWVVSKLRGETGISSRVNKLWKVSNSSLRPVSISLCSAVFDSKTSSCQDPMFRRSNLVLVSLLNPVPEGNTHQEQLLFSSLKSLEPGAGAELVVVVAFGTRYVQTDDVKRMSETVHKLRLRLETLCPQNVSENRVGHVRVCWIQMFDPKKSSLRVSSIRFAQALRAATSTSRPQCLVLRESMFDIMNIAVTRFLDSTESRTRTFTSWTNSFARLLSHLATVVCSASSLERAHWPPSLVDSSFEDTNRIPSRAWNARQHFAKIGSILNSFQLASIPNSLNHYDQDTVALRDVVVSYACRALDCDEDDSTITKISKRCEKFKFDDMDAIRETFEFETIVLWRDIFEIIVARKIMDSEPFCKDMFVYFCPGDAHDTFESLITHIVRSCVNDDDDDNVSKPCLFNNLALYVARRDVHIRLKKAQKEKRQSDSKSDVSESRGLKRSAIQDLSSSTVLKRLRANDVDEEEEDMKDEEDEIKRILQEELKDLDYFENHLQDALINTTADELIENKTSMLDDILIQSREENKNYESALEGYLLKGSSIIN